MRLPGFGPHDNDFVAAQLFEETQLVARYKEYMDEQRVNIFLGSWNVNAKVPAQKDRTKLIYWLRSDPDFIPEMYVIALQEICDLSVGIVNDDQSDLAWRKTIESVLPPGVFRRVAHKRLVGILLLVYASKKIADHIPPETVCVETLGTGLFGFHGNKGGVACRFKLYDSSLCFVASHLAAHKNNVSGRNEDFHDIVNNIKFDIPGDGIKRILDNDIIFWTGDLNYRLDLDDLEQVYKFITKKDYDYLLQAHDQLNKERTSGNVFREFEEGTIKFPPTYKFIPGTNVYDRRPDKKQRMPAWCDRILWRTGEASRSDISDVTQHIYSFSQEQTISDHKPVYAHFTVVVNDKNEDKFDEIYEEIQNQAKLGSRADLLMPQVRIVPPKIQLKSMYFDDVITRSIHLSNVGSVCAHFAFLPQNDSNEISRPWLKISPQQGSVNPGEVKRVLFTACVSRDTVQEVMECYNRLEDVVTMSIRYGKNEIIPVTGTFLISCFGQSLEFLCKIHKPIRLIDLDHFEEPKKILSLPKELWRMADYIVQYIDTPHLFRLHGTVEEFSLIRECLDYGKKFDAFTVHSMAEALLRFLENLSEPIFPPYLAQQPATPDTLHFAKDILIHLPLSHYNTLLYTFSFLRKLLSRKHFNFTDPQSLALQFSAALMHKRTEDSKNIQQSSLYIIMFFMITASEHSLVGKG